MGDNLTEFRERHGRQYLPRFFPGETDDKQREIRERYLGIGIALGAGFGVAVGAGLAVVLGNLALGIALGLCFGGALGIAVGSILGDKRAKGVRDFSNAQSSHRA